MGSRAIAPLVVTAALAASAAAQPKPTGAQRQQAGDLVKQAIAKSQAGDHEAAIELYMNAFEIVPQPVLLSNIATEYQRLRKPVEALKYFCKYLEREPTGGSASYATAQAKVIAIELGEKNVDDATVCKPRPAAAPAKEPRPAPPPSAPATAADATAPTEAEPALEYGGIGVAAAGAVALGFGIYYGVHAKSISDFITGYVHDNPGRPWPSDINQLESDGKSAQTAQIVLDIAGPIALVAGGVMFWIGRPHKKAADALTIAPILRSGIVGLAASGSF